VTRQGGWGTGGCAGILLSSPLLHVSNFSSFSYRSLLLLRSSPLLHVAPLLRASLSCRSTTPTYVKVYSSLLNLFYLNSLPLTLFLRLTLHASTALIAVQVYFFIPLFFMSLTSLLFRIARFFFVSLGGSNQPTNLPLVFFGYNSLALLVDCWYSISWWIAGRAVLVLMTCA